MTVRGSFSLVEGAVTLRDSSGTEVGTGTDPVRVDPTGTTTQPVSAASLPLPVDAATETTQATLLTEADFDAKLGDPVASPAANTLLGRVAQLITDFASLLSRIPATLGQATKGLSFPVTVASDQKDLTLDSVIDAGNSTSTPLGAGGGFTGAAVDLLNYNSIVVNVHASTNGGVLFQFSTNGTNWATPAGYSFTYISSNGMKVYHLKPAARYFRFVWSGSGQPAQTFFRVQTRLSVGSHKGSFTRAATAINEDDDAEIVKAILTGKDGAIYRDITSDSAGRLEGNTVLYRSDGVEYEVDGNGRLEVLQQTETKSLGNSLRVVNPVTLGDYIFTYGIDARRFWQNTAGSGTITHDSAKSSARMQVTTASGDQAELRSHQYHRYQAGKPQFMEMTGFAESSPGANQTIRIGMFDDDDGYFFRINQAGWAVVVRSSASGSLVERVTLSGAWSEGVSPPTITNGNIFGIRYRWLGFGSVQFFLNEALVHQEDNWNTRAEPLSRTGALPVSASLENDGASIANSWYFTCAQVLSEGGSSPPLRLHTQAGTVKPVGTGAEVPLLSIRTKTTLGGNPNRNLIFPRVLSAYTDSARARIRIWLNPATLTGASWSSFSSESSIEVDTSATALSGGEIITEITLPRDQDGTNTKLDHLFSQLVEFLRLHADGTTPDVLTISAINTKAGSTDMAATLTWGEQR